MNTEDERIKAARAEAWDRCVHWFATQPQRIGYRLGSPDAPLRFHPIVRHPVIEAAEQENPYRDD